MREEVCKKLLHAHPGYLCARVRIIVRFLKRGGSNFDDSGNVGMFEWSSLKSPWATSSPT